MIAGNDAPPSQGMHTSRRPRVAAFIFRQGDERELKEFSRGLAGETLVVLQAHTVSDDRACPVGSRLVWYDDFASEADLSAIDEHAHRLVRSWYQAPDDPSEFRGVSMTQLYELDLVGHLAWTFRDALIVDRLIRELRPTRLGAAWHPERNPVWPVERVAELVAVQHDVAFERVIPTGASKPPRTGVVLPGARLATGNRAARALALKAARRYWRARGRIERVRRGPAVLFWPFWRFRPVIDELTTRSSLRPLIAGTFGPRQDYYVSRNVRHLWVEDYLTPRQWGEAKAAAVAQLVAQWRRLAVDPAYQRQFSYEGVPLWLAVSPRLEQVWQEFAAWAAYCEASRTALLREGVEVVVTHQEELAEERALALVSRQLGIPSLFCQHGPESDYPIWSPTVTSHVTVWGDGSLPSMTRRAEANGTTVVVTGEPSLDHADGTVERGHREGTLAKLGLDPRKKSVLVMAQPAVPFTALSMATDPERFAAAIVHAAAALKECQFIYKLHYADGGQFERQLERTNALPANLRLLDHNEARHRGLDTLRLAGACDLLVTQSSTSGLEGLLVGTALLVVNLTGRADLLRYVQDGAAAGVRVEQDLAPAILAALEVESGTGVGGEAVRRFTRRELSNSEARDATVRLADLIERLARGPAIEARHPAEAT